MGRPGLAPGVYFRLLMLGYFERIPSERQIAWRVADSLSLRHWLGLIESLARQLGDAALFEKIRIASWGRRHCLYRMRSFW